jgi:hypothetical protein
VKFIDGIQFPSPTLLADCQTHQYGSQNQLGAEVMEDEAQMSESEDGEDEEEEEEDDEEDGTLDEDEPSDAESVHSVSSINSRTPAN